MRWQAAQETALLDAFLEELGAVPTASSRTTMGGRATKVVPAFRAFNRGQNLQVSSRLGWAGSVVLHGLFICGEAS